MLHHRLIPLALLLAALAVSAFAQQPVRIEGIYPGQGLPGETIIVKGTGFVLGDTGFAWAANLRRGDPCPGFVEFNGARGEVMLWQDNLIMVAVPSHATSGPVRVTLAKGIAVLGNHFEILNPTDADTPGPKREYAFEERSGITLADNLAFNRGLYPSPYYFYHGYRPRLGARQTGGIPRRWDQDGGLDFFLVSGPLLRTCGLITGLDDVLFFPGQFSRDFDSRWGWWDQALSGPDPFSGPRDQRRRKYRFEE